MNVNPVPLRAQARVLSSPKIKYGQNQTVTPSQAIWSTQQFWKPAVISGLVVLNYAAHTVSREETIAFVKCLLERLRALGVELRKGPLLIPGDPISDIVRVSQLSQQRTCRFNQFVDRSDILQDVQNALGRYRVERDGVAGLVLAILPPFGGRDTRLRVK